MKRFSTLKQMKDFFPWSSMGIGLMDDAKISVSQEEYDWYVSLVSPPHELGGCMIEDCTCKQDKVFFRGVQLKVDETE
jgi:hypothetical protein